MSGEIFYTDLGKLLCIAADIDGVITQKEKKILLNMLQRERGTDYKNAEEFDMDIAFDKEREFCLSDEPVIDPEITLESLTRMVEDNYGTLDKKTQELCLYVADKLANAYRDTNKKEKIMMDRLRYKIVKMELKNLLTSNLA